MSHIWTSNSISRAETTTRVRPLAKQPEGLDTPLHALPYGAFYAAIPDGAALPELERAIRTGKLCGIVAIRAPRCWRVYACGKASGEFLSEACAYGELAGLVERPGWRQRLACWLLEWHDRGTAADLQTAARDLCR
jgi:hypothetical protein